MKDTACRNMPNLPVLTVFLIWAIQLIDGQGVSHVIVTPQVVAVGGCFTVSCDASRAGVPEIASTVSSLTLGWTDGRSPPTEYSGYGILPPYNFTNPPPSRNWTFEFTGSLQGTSDRPFNRNTMRIEMVVHNTKLADTGFYICGASYFFWVDEEISVYKFQHITIDGNLV
ncbi:uncharacterized protein LOC131944605 [Physella acuta]|uniref:uncharacterized protein LOC131944605 n=1 Tax=Physella acuta TaxID=109671 RepID=UPI0027DB63C1|nr:uncharacterized protein LOC131944605 [Physella acuta]